ncbi:response regulator [Paracoccaceae bacterium]|nr:response regulator [Paracoccaceae bacterium]
MCAINVACDDTTMAVIFAACPQHSTDDLTNDKSFHKMPVPLLKLAINGDLLMANEAALRLLDINSVENLNLRDLMDGLGQSFNEWLNRSAFGVHHPSSEFLRLKRGETETFLQVTLSRIMEKDGPQLFAVLIDATALKTLEGQFVQSQKMQAIGQLAGGIAHDFNNLFTAISGYCDLLLLRHEPTDQDFPDLIEIHENANRAASLIDQLLAFSRKQTLRPRTLNLQDVMSDLTHLLNRLLGEKVVLHLRQGAIKCHVRADKRQVKQVIMNLVVNRTRCDAFRRRCHNRNLRVAPDKTARTRPSYCFTRRVYLCESYRSGHGNPAGCLPKIFEPFYTTKPMGEGTGLGLSMVYGIMKQSGGYVFVDSVLGQNSCFTLLFPAHQGPVDDSYTLAAPVKKKTLPARAEGVVLLVEDEAPVRAFAVRALQLRGYTVLEADGGERALEILQDPDLLVEVFVTDVIMPGLDGPAWARRALKSRPGTKVIFMSGYARNFLDDEACETYQSVFLPKPFSLTALS